MRGRGAGGEGGWGRESRYLGEKQSKTIAARFPRYVRSWKPGQGSILQDPTWKPWAPRPLGAGGTSEAGLGLALADRNFGEGVFWMRLGLGGEEQGCGGSAV